jgi:hypothetical protein
MAAMDGIHDAGKPAIRLFAQCSKARRMRES